MPYAFEEDIKQETPQYVFEDDLPKSEPQAAQAQYVFEDELPGGAVAPPGTPAPEAMGMPDEYGSLPNYGQGNEDQARQYGNQPTTGRPASTIGEDGLVSRPTELPGFQDPQAAEFGRKVTQPITRAPIEVAGTAALLLGGISAGNQKTQGALFKFYDTTRNITAQMAPDADASFVEKFLDGALGMAPYLMTGGAGAASILANSATQGAEALKQGVDPATATTIAAKNLVMTAAMFRAPFGGKTYASGIAKGAGINMALDLADKYLEKGILSQADYQELADKINPWEAGPLGQAAAMGGVFGAQGTAARRAAVPRTLDEYIAQRSRPAQAQQPPVSATPEPGPTNRPEVIHGQAEPVAQAGGLNIEGTGVPRGAVPPEVTKNVSRLMPIEGHQSIISKKTADMTPEERGYALTHDHLTGLPNRKALEESPEQPNLVLLDVDGFKQVNDRFGHDAGNEYLQAIRQAVEDNGIDWLHRLHGDEHAFYASSRGEARGRALALDNAMRGVTIEVIDTKSGEKYTLQGVGFSYGIGEGKSLDEKFKSADTELYQHKEFRTEFGQRVPGQLPAEVSITPRSEGRRPENRQSSGILSETLQVTPEEKNLLETAASFMQGRTRYDAYEGYMSARPAGWSFDKGGEFLARVARGEATPKTEAQKRFVEEALKGAKDYQERAAEYEKLPPIPEGLTLTPPEEPKTQPKTQPAQEGLNLGLKGADLRAPERENKPVSINELPLGKATNEARDREEQTTIPEIRTATEPVKQSFPTQSAKPGGKTEPTANKPDTAQLYTFPGPLLKQVRAEIQKLNDSAVIDGLKRSFAAITRPGAEKSGAELSEQVARMERYRDQFLHGMKAADKLFKRSPNDVNIDFMQRMDTGEAQKIPEFQAIADRIKDMFDEKVKAIQELGTGALQQARENYFPHIWERGKGNEILQALTRRPFEGKKGFLKQRVFDDVLSGIEAGYKPVSHNPLDLVALKMAEMDKYIVAHRTINALKESGEIKYFRVGQKPPTEEGWVQINDRFGIVYGKPEVGIKEAYDKKVMEQLQSVAKDLGISHERLVKIGGRRWGYAEQGTNRIVSKFSGPESVIAHEIGHQLDWKYNLQTKLFGGGRPVSDFILQRMKTKAEREGLSKGKTASQIEEQMIRNKELRALADARFEGEETSESFKKYVRKGEEKMAVMFEALIHAPNKFKDVAPNIYDYLQNFAEKHPEIKPLFNIKPSLVLGVSSEAISTGGPVIKGYYYAKDATAQILNNYLSQNLYNNKYIGSFFSAYMGVANHLNQFQLGVGSMFHGGFTSMESVISHAALGVRQLSEGRFVDAAKSFGKAPAAWVINPMLGDKLIKEWNQPGTQGADMAQIIEGLQASGGRLHPLRGERFQTNDTKKMLEAWHSGTATGKVKAVLRSPLALVEQSARPILEWLVPRQKFGVFGELMNDWMKQHPAASHEEMRSAARQFWNRVDSRLGQVVYDRIFAHNIAKNVVQALVRAPGWTGGTILEVGGSGIDAIKFLIDISEGKRPVVTDRMAYTLSLLMVTATVNGLLTAAFTGEAPKDKDFWAFRTGRKDRDGRDERYMLPTYAKDIYAYYQAPLTILGHKTHPAISASIDLAKNKDFYGNQIRNEDENYVYQLGQVAGFAVKQFKPFWISGLQKAEETGKSAAAGLAPLVGVMPAPKSMTQTPAERLVDEINRGKKPEGGYTEAQQERREAKRDIVQSLRNGEISSMAEINAVAREKGITLSHQDKQNMALALKEDPAAERKRFFNKIRSFSADEIMRVWDRMNEEERDKYYQIIHHKVLNSRTITRAERQEYLLRIKGE